LWNICAPKLFNWIHRYLAIVCFPFMKLISLIQLNFVCHDSDTFKWPYRCQKLLYHMPRSVEVLWKTVSKSHLVVFLTWETHSTCSHVDFPGQENHLCDIYTQKTHSCGLLIILYNRIYWWKALATHYHIKPKSHCLKFYPCDWFCAGGSHNINHHSKKCAHLKWVKTHLAHIWACHYCNPTWWGQAAKSIKYFFIKCSKNGARGKITRQMTLNVMNDWWSILREINRSVLHEIYYDIECDEWLMINSAWDQS
jgi:hypothetical protein